MQSANPVRKKFRTPATPYQCWFQSTHHLKHYRATLKRGAGLRIFFCTGWLGMTHTLATIVGYCHVHRSVHTGSLHPYIVHGLTSILQGTHAAQVRLPCAMPNQSQLDAFSRGAIVGMAAAGASATAIAAKVKKPDRTQQTTQDGFERAPQKIDSMLFRSSLTTPF